MVLSLRIEILVQLSTGYLKNVKILLFLGLNH